MQTMATEWLKGYRNEFELTCAAQDGNGKAWMALWNHYRPLMMSRLRKVMGIPREDLESEACELFAYKLKGFNRDKVSSEDGFSMFLWLYFGSINKMGKLIQERKKEVHLYFEDVRESKRFYKACRALRLDVPMEDETYGYNKLGELDKFTLRATRKSW